jgi:hypothetical protein
MIWPHVSLLWWTRTSNTRPLFWAAWDQSNQAMLLVNPVLAGKVGISCTILRNKIRWSEFYRIILNFLFKFQLRSPRFTRFQINILAIQNKVVESYIHSNLFLNVWFPSCVAGANTSFCLFVRKCLFLYFKNIFKRV